MFHEMDVANLNAFAHFTKLQRLFQIFDTDTRPAPVRDTRLGPFPSVCMSSFFRTNEFTSCDFLERNFVIQIVVASSARLIPCLSSYLSNIRSG